MMALYPFADLSGMSCHGEIVESPSLNARRKLSVAVSPIVAVE